MTQGPRKVDAARTLRLARDVLATEARAIDALAHGIDVNLWSISSDL